MVGRALWGDYVSAPAGDQKRLMEDPVVRPRFVELCSLARPHGRDWGKRCEVSVIDERWFLTY